MSTTSRRLARWALALTAGLIAGPLAVAPAATAAPGNAASTHGDTAEPAAAQGTAQQGTAWHSTARQAEARPGATMQGTARPGTVRQAEAQPGTARQGTARQGTAAQDAPQQGTTSRVALKLERDGKLTVTERITAPAGRTLTRTVPLRFAAGERTDRVFAISNATVQGTGTAGTTDDTFTVTVTGNATVHYVVDGAVVRAADHEEVRWQAFSGWNAPFDSVTASLVTPRRPEKIDCLAGSPSSTAACATVDGTASGLVLAEQPKLAPGDRLNLAVRLPADTVPANAITAQTSAFALTAGTGLWLLGVAVALLLAVGALWLTRGRDAHVGGGEQAMLEPLLLDQQGRTHFASPDGVLPGQIGTVVDQHVDVVDVTATVVDLAVRNYLWISQAEDGADWWIVRRNPVDDALTDYERAVLDAVLPDGADSVLLSEWQVPNLAAVRAAMYADVTGKGWFTRRPDAERRRWLAAGIAVAGAGVLLTLILALTVGHALVGLGVVLGGAALAVVARWMPARTRRGSAVVRQVIGLGRYLDTATPDRVTEADREMVFSRSLPYAVVLGQWQRWLSAFAYTDTAADGAAGLYWFATTTEVPDLTEFAGQFPAFVRAVDTAVAAAGSVRSHRSR